MIKKLFNEVLNFIFPTFCCHCSRIGEYLCRHCSDQLEFLPMPTKLKLSEIHLDEVRAAVNYQPPITKLIQEMKYGSVKGIGKYCGQFLYDTTNFPTPDLVTSVPLHHKRQNTRGFNQAAEIARELARLLQVPYLELLTRTKHTINQASLINKQTRMKNLANIFAFKKIPSEKLHQLTQTFPHILLVDDVTTTGATLNECAKVLKQQNFQKVFGLTVAHGIVN